MSPKTSKSSRVPLYLEKNQVLGPGALGRARGIGWRGRWEGGSGWGIHVNPWLIHVNVWQKPLQYCKVISLGLIKINEKKEKNPLSLPVPNLNTIVTTALPSSPSGLSLELSTPVTLAQRLCTSCCLCLKSSSSWSHSQIHHISYTSVYMSPPQDHPL